MKNVLIALDYDPTAQKVAETGLMLAKTMKAEVILLHVISDPVNYTSAGHITIMGFSGYKEACAAQVDSDDALIKASHEFLDKTKIHLKDKNIKTLVVEGDCAESILKEAKKNKTDIIVMGSHSKKWLENIVMGSVTEKVLHQTSIPLLVIPTKKRK